MNAREEQFSGRFAHERDEAEARLWKRMEERGMTREGGWKVAEFTRDTRGGSERVLRPMHLWHESPYDMDCVVWTCDEEGKVAAKRGPEPAHRADTPPA